MRRKAGQRVALMLTGCFLVLLLALFYVGYTGPQQLQQLDRYFARLLKYYEVSISINHLTTSVQEYILYGDLQALNDFRYYSRQAVESELALYNLVDQSQKQLVEELVVLTNNYNLFMEKEVIPAKKAESAEQMGEVLRWQYLDLTHQLVYRAQSLTEAGRTETQQSLRQTMAAVKKKAAFPMFISLSTLGTFFGAIILIRPWLVRNFLFASLVAGFPNAVLIVDCQERLQYLNQAAEDLFGLPREKVKGQTTGEVLRSFPHLQGIVQPLRDVIFQKKKLTGYRTTYFRQENRIQLSIDYLPVNVLRRLAGVVLLIREVPWQKDGNILLDAIEAERKRISIEIHDWIGRYMSAIIHGLDYVLRMKEAQLPSEVEENIVMLRTQCQKAAIDMRSIMNDIHPYLIEKAGLIPALESYVANFERIHNKKVYIYYQHSSLPLTSTDQITVYRIVQEALTNVARHSAATEVDIYFNDSGDSVAVEIIDNGGSKEPSPVPGKGLWGMKERARSMGGNLLYGYREGGFFVTLTVPKGEAKQNGSDPDHAGGRS